MDTTDILLSRIIADPSDLILREVYADALDERGGEDDQLRAELIRTMIDIGRDDPDFRLDWSMNAKVYDESADPRIRRTAELVRDVKWHRRESGNPVFWYFSNCVWRNGFPEQFRGTVREWAEIGDTLCAEGPVTVVEFKSWYWGDVVPVGYPEVRSVTHHSLLPVFRWSMRWEVKGKPPTDFQQENPTLAFSEIFQNTLWDLTIMSFRTWWPTVKQWDVKRDSVPAIIHRRP